jgi:hypothetical protein
VRTSFSIHSNSLRESLDEVRQAIHDERIGFDVDLPERPEPDVDPPDESDWLYDASRSYLEQLPYYRAHKHGNGQDSTNGTEETDA